MKSFRTAEAQRRGENPGREGGAEQSEAGAWSLRSSSAPLRLCGSISFLVLAAFGLPAQAASIVLAQTPLFLNSGVQPNVLVVMDNSESMDATMAGTVIAGSDPTTRANVGRQVMVNTLTNYRTAFNWGLMSYAYSGTAALYNTYPYFMGSGDGDNNTGTMVFTRDCVAVAPATTVSVDTPGVSASNGNRQCVPNPQPFAGGQFVTYELSSDDPTVNDVLYDSRKLPSIWNLTRGPGVSFDGYQTYNGTSSWSKSGFSNSLNTFTFSATDAGYVPKNPPMTRVLFLPRAWGYLNSVTGLGKLNESVLVDSTTHFNNLMALLAAETNNPATGELKNAAVFTPLPGTLLSAYQYFSGTNSYTTPIQYSCQRNFVMLVTDGLPTAQTNGAQYAYTTTTKLYDPQAVTDTLSALACLQGSGPKTGFCTAAGVKPASQTGPGAGGIFPVETYVVALGDTLANAGAVASMNSMASAGGTGSAFLATNQTAFENAIQTIVLDIVAKTGSASAISLNRGTWSTGSTLYQARFSSGDWSGQLLAYTVNMDGSLAASANWDSGQILNAQDWNTSRTILTYKPSASAGSHGVALRWPANPAAPTSTELDAAQVALLNQNASGTTDGYGSQRLAWLRGSRSNEPGICPSCTPLFRNRPTSVLGDIVDSSPYYVGAPPFNYADSAAPTKYSAFYASNKSRPAMVYVGANDGMLHGFDALTGTERLAYLPGKLYSTARLSQLPQTGYSHRFFVDGTPTMGDAWLASDSAWHTLLVGGLAAGGQGLYALDITNPAAFSETGTAPQKTVLWEFSDANDTGDTDTTADPTLRYGLGYTFSEPLIVRTNASDTLGHARNRWVAIIGNGYNNTEADGAASTSGYAILYILDAQTGAVLRKLNTKTGSATTPNGLASPTAIDADGNGTADYVFAGDLNGNMWKFDLSDTNPANWKVAFGTATAPLPLVANGRTSQQVTSAPEVGKAANGGFMVYFGTGKYLESADATTTATQSFYGIWDRNDGSTHYTLGSGTGLGSANLLLQTIDDTLSTTNNGVSSTWRVSSQQSTNGTNSQNAVTKIGTAGSFLGAFNGWYLDLPAGERQVTAPVLTSSGKIVFTTMLPNTNPCSYGGSGWVMELDAARGDRLALTFDVNGDGKLSSVDTVNSSVAGRVAPSGTYFAGIPTSPGILGGNPKTQRGAENKYMSLSNGSVSRVMETSTSRVGRVSWQQLQ